MSKRRRFEGVLNLPWPLPVMTEALGMLQTVVLDGCRTQLSLPSLEGEFPNSWLVAPTDVKGAELRGDVRSLASWGGQFNRAQYSVDAIRLSMLLNDSGNISSAAVVLRPWLDTVQLWVESWLESPMQQRASQGLCRGDHPRVRGEQPTP